MNFVGRFGQNSGKNGEVWRIILRVFIDFLLTVFVFSLTRNLRKLNMSIMKSFLQKLRRVSRAIFCLALLLIIYGYAARVLHVYFFWESLTIGWPLLLIGAVFCLFDLVREKKRNSKKSIGEKVVIGVLLFIVAMQVVLFFVVHHSDAYAAAKKYISASDSLRKIVGHVQVVEASPVGSISETSKAGVVTGKAELSVTVKGDKAFCDMVLYLEKDAEADWRVVGYE